MGLAGFRRRLTALIVRHGDIALAGALAAGALIEAVLEANTVSESRFPPLTLLATVPLVWRRRWPMLVMAAVLLGAVISREAPYVEIACAAIAAYSVGAHERHRLLGVVELLVVGGVVLATFGGRLPPIPDLLGPFVVLLPLWMVGAFMRQGRARAEAMAERARRLEAEQRLNLVAAQAEERARIAREMHDVVAHSVSVMVVQAGAARQVVQRAPDRADDALEAVEETGRQAMDELRRILGVLGDAGAELDPQPTLAQVGALVGAIRDAGLPITFEVKGIPRALPATIELAAYRVVQEALTNALKHSGLAPTQVFIDHRPRELKLEILCDGDASSHSASPPGRGIAGMKERVALVGGRIEAGPGVERGYNVRAWLPLDSGPGGTSGP